MAEEIAGCRAFGHRDLAPAEWCRNNQHRAFCAGCRYFRGGEVSVAQKKKYKEQQIEEKC